MRRANQASSFCRNELVGNGRKQGVVGNRIAKDATIDVQAREATFWEEEPNRTGTAIQFVGDEAADPTGLLGCGSHERDLSIVPVDRAAGELQSHSLGRTKGHDVEPPQLPT